MPVSKIKVNGVLVDIQDKELTQQVSVISQQVASNTQAIQAIAASGGASLAEAVIFPDGENLAVKMQKKTEKVRVDITGTTGNYQFELNGVVLDFATLNYMLQESPDFVVFVHGNREHRCVEIILEGNPKSMTFLAPTIEGTNVKAQSFKVVSTDGTSISSIKRTDIICENKTDTDALRVKVGGLSQQISDLDKSIFDEPHDYAAELLAQTIIVSSASGASVRVDGNKLYYSCTNRVASWFGFSNAILDKDTRYHLELVPSDITKIVKASKVAFLSGTSSGYVVSDFTQDEGKLVYVGKLNDDPTQGRQTSISLDGNYTYDDFEFTLKVVKEGATKSLKEGIVSQESLDDDLNGKIGSITPAINGESNLFVGKNAGVNTIESPTGNDGRWNAAFGVNAMKDNTTGDHCTAVGFQAMQKNTTGDANTAIGEDALYENTTGTGNTSVGAHNMQNCKGSQNTSVGTSGLQNLTTGAFNTQIGGYNGGSRLTTGSRNTLIGAGANVAEGHGAINDAIVIGMTSANKDGQIIIGSSNNVEFVIRLNIGKIKLIFNADHTVSWEVIE